MTIDDQLHGQFIFKMIVVQAKENEDFLLLFFSSLFN